jgi:spermidine/putrescine-binding protein
LKTSPLLILATAALVVAACSSETTPEIDTPLPVTTVEEELSCEAGEIDGDLHLYAWPDYVPPELIAEFEQEHGIEILQDFYESNDELLAKLQSGAVYDLVFPSDHMVTVLAEGGFLTQIQPEAAPGLSNLDARFADPAYDPGGRHSVAYLWGTIGLGVDLEKVRLPEEAGWGLVFDPDVVADHEGTVSLLDDPRQTLGAALKYLGYSINSTDLGEVEEAADVVTGIMGFEVNFDSGGGESPAFDDDVAIAHGRSDVIGAAIRDQDRFAFLTPADGSAIWVDTMAVTANAAHSCTAHTFIDYLLDGENAATVAGWTRLASPNRVARGLIDPAILEDRSIYPPDEVEELLEMIEDLGQLESEYSDYFAIARS